MMIALVSMTIQNRPDAQGKLDAFMTKEDIEHCPPSDNDWLVAFNDHSSHSTVIGLLDEAIAASEPCEAMVWTSMPGLRMGKRSLSRRCYRKQAWRT